MKIKTSRIFKTKKEALEVVGGLGSPSKMPGLSLSIPPEYCKTGSRLRKIEGSVCENCYARKGRYIFPSVKNALQRRYDNLKDPDWINAMSFLLKNEKFFRWHDSGDIQGIWHLKNIVSVCENTPNCKFWLPTKEPGIIKAFLNGGGKIPDNLNVTISAGMINRLPDIMVEGCGITTCSTADSLFKNSVNCPATFNKDIHTCESANCFACWDKDVKHVNYKKH
jgi:hypothetical protein